MNSWIIVAVTLFFSALCSGLEIAFNSINRLQLEFWAIILRLSFMA